MAHKFCSFCCFSCSCCTSPISSPQHPTLTIKDFKIYLQKYSDINHIYTLSPLLKELLKIASGEGSDAGGSTSAAAAPFTQDGHRMLEMLSKRFGKRPVKENSEDGTFEEYGKVCIEVLKGSEKIPQVGIALCILGSVLERFSKVSENKKECLVVLKRIVDLGDQIMKLNDLIPDEKKKLDDAVGYIVEGSIMCISQLDRTTIIPSWVTATVDKENLDAFHRKLDRFYDNIQLSTAIGIAHNLPKLVRESQKIYGYQPTVGIEEAKKEVIQLLDLNSQDTRTVVVVVHGFGGIGKTTLADAVYSNLNLESYKHCRIHMEQGCTNNDLNRLQKKILYELFEENIKLKDCDEGRGLLQKSFTEYSNQPLFLYIDNALKYTDLKQLLPKRLDICLPPKSRILVTTRNVRETDILIGKNIVRREYDVNPLPEKEARKLLLEKVSDYDDEDSIVNLLNLCNGVPLLLELAGSQLATNEGNRRNIVLEMVTEGKQVKERDISDRMVGFVYDRFLPSVQEAFLDIASFFYGWNDIEGVSRIVGEEEFKALESASFVKVGELGEVIVHDIIRARGKMLSEGNRVTNVDTLLECLDDDEKLRQLRGIYFDEDEEDDQPAIEINCHQLNCMRHSLRLLNYKGSEIRFREKCQKPFEQLRYLCVDGDVADLPMEFEKLKRLIFYRGPFTQGMNLYEFPPSLRYMFLRGCPENRVAYSKVVPPKVTQPSSLVDLWISDFKNIERLPDGVEMLTELQTLTLYDLPELRELPCKLGQLQNLGILKLVRCFKLVKLPSDLSQLTKLKHLILSDCSQLVELSSDFGQLQNLESLDLSGCSGLVELPSDFGQLKKLKELDLTNCYKLEKWPSSFGDLTQMRKIYLNGCLSKLVDSLPKNMVGIIVR